jgi:hypothetical protein
MKVWPNWVSRAWPGNVGLTLAACGGLAVVVTGMKYGALPTPFPDLSARISADLAMKGSQMASVLRSDLMNGADLRVTGFEDGFAGAASSTQKQHFGNEWVGANGEKIYFSDNMCAIHPKLKDPNAHLPLAWERTR